MTICRFFLFPDLWLCGSQEALLAAACHFRVTPPIHTSFLYLCSTRLPPTSYFSSHLCRTSVLLSPPSLLKTSRFMSFVLLPLPSLLRPLLCPFSLSLFFFRAPGGAPRGPVVEAFLHRPQPGLPPLSGPGTGPPPPPVLLPPPPLPKLAHLRPRSPRVPPRSAPGPALHTPASRSVTATARGLVGTVLVLWLTLMLCLLMFLHACLFLWLCRLQAGVV